MAFQVELTSDLSHPDLDLNLFASCPWRHCETEPSLPMSVCVCDSENFLWHY